MLKDKIATIIQQGYVEKTSSDKIAEQIIYLLEENVYETLQGAWNAWKGQSKWAHQIQN